MQLHSTCTRAEPSPWASRDTIGGGLVVDTESEPCTAGAWMELRGSCRNVAILYG